MWWGRSVMLTCWRELHRPPACMCTNVVGSDVPEWLFGEGVQITCSKCRFRIWLLSLLSKFAGIAEPTACYASRDMVGQTGPKEG